jgi:hypothetical protein
MAVPVQRSSRCSVEKGYNNTATNTSGERDAQRAPHYVSAQQIADQRAG